MTTKQTWKTKGTYNGPDWLAKNNAMILCERIRNYWMFRGREVNVWYEAIYETPESPASAIYVVRSNIGQTIGAEPWPAK